MVQADRLRELWRGFQSLNLSGSVVVGESEDVLSGTANYKHKQVQKIHIWQTPCLSACVQEPPKPPNPQTGKQKIAKPKLKSQTT